MDLRGKQIDTKNGTAETLRLHLRPMMDTVRRRRDARRSEHEDIFWPFANFNPDQEPEMKTYRKHLLAALSALTLGAAALGAHAQTADQAATPQGRQGMHAQHQKLTPEQRAQFRAQRIARLHDELKITPAQENAWNAFVASMQPPARQQHDRAAWANLTAPERMAKMIERQKQRTAALEQRQGALNTFYSVLNADQKKTFDEKAAHFGREHGGRHDWQHRG
jgi:Spy/CpxP family protein refolding chaperone